MDTLDFIIGISTYKERKNKNTPHLESGKKFKTIVTSDIQEPSHTQNI